MTTIDAQCAFPMSQQPAAHTRSHLDVMKLLVRFPLLSVADLAFALGHSATWTYAQMRALRAAGLVEPTSVPVCGAMCATHPRSNMEGQMTTTMVYAATLKGLEWLEAASGP
ncbi:MAG TPA: MarR family winged helix-turn-helix transcriptional regulator, partial [Ktedonobacterales bacterium]|nr:MarR family winged helix-turn-helix transcriptional regulator [Ktedonobacterales bacterium]